MLQKKKADKMIARADFKATSVCRNGLTIIHLAAMMNMESTNFELLLKKDLKCLDCKDAYGNLPIHSAASIGMIPNIKKIISINKKYLNAQTEKGYTPLICAVLNDCVKSVSELLALGADPNHRLPNGMNSLILAIVNNF
jgi:ankyrin repeat protein